MDIRNVGNSGNTDPLGDLHKRTGTKPDYVIPAAPKDAAQISATGRATAATVDSLAEQARTGEIEDRAAKIALAIDKLNSGELDGDAVLAATASRLLDGGFVSG